MRKIITLLLLCFTLQHTFGQAKKNSTYLQTQYNKTLHDKTKGNNPWSIGVGLQTFFSDKNIKPTAELTGDIYLMDDKVLRLNPDGTVPANYNDVRGMLNLFAGISYHPIPNVYLSFLAGPTFIRQILFGIKPSVGFYFSSAQKWTGKVSYINILNRDKNTKEDFSSVSFSLGVKLF